MVWQHPKSYKVNAMTGFKKLAFDGVERQTQVSQVGFNGETGIY